MRLLQLRLVNFAPPRVKFFGWLLTQNGIHCRMALVHKNILDDARCELCSLGDETADHIFSECSFVQSFWTHIGCPPSGIAKVSELWNTQPPPRIAKAVLNPLLLFCWEIWKHRNEVVFRGMAPDISQLRAACKESIKAWCCRIPRKDESLARQWSNVMSM